MKLYTAMAPNPLRVHVFLAEKGLEVPTVNLDVLKGDTRTSEFLEKNALGEVPVLELDDGRILTESVAICRYLEALHPETPLMGSDAIEQAHIEMWNRRMELKIFFTIGQVGQHEFKFFAESVEQNAIYAASQRRALAHKWVWLNDEMSDGRAFVAGDSFTIADITGMAALIVCGFANETIPDTLRHVKQWEQAVRTRPSWPM